MGFPVDLTAALTGASVWQLASWRKDLLQPEVQSNPVLYSFRDLLALRMFVRLRSEVSLQRIRKAVSTMREWDLTQHPSRYTLLTDGDTVFLQEHDRAIDLVRRPGQEVLLSVEDAFAPFTNLQGRGVVDFRHPRPHVEVEQQRLGGWPTVAGTRVAYDTVAKLVEGGIPPGDVERFYPSVTRAAAADAADFHAEVTQLRRTAA
jgi:uncharacterized protein (DUF433 family)